MRIYVEEDEPEATTALVARLFPGLLQAIAMTELMIVERWCEPPQVDRLHLSTLVQQVMSVIAESGGVRADRLYAALGYRRLGVIPGYAYTPFGALAGAAFFYKAIAPQTERLA